MTRFQAFFAYSKHTVAHIITGMMERAVCRIVDANFNRAREAIRVVEEYCRFALNSPTLTNRAKQFRHELCGAIGTLDAGRLITSRDTPGDVGVAQVVDNQLGRGDLRDSLTAGCKRLTEALRALAEVIRIENPPLAEAVEKLGVQTTGPIFEMYCPMAFDDKGATWLQKEEEIQNPYFGAAMLKCGEVSRRLKEGY